MDDKLKSLYDNLSKDGYELPDLETFRSDMNDKTKAQRLYSTLVSDGYEVPESFETFHNDIIPQSASIGDYIGAGAGAFNRGVGKVASSPFKLIEAGGDVLNKVFTGQESSHPEGETFLQNPAGIIGRGIENFFNDVNPRYENVNQTYQNVGEGVGQALGIAATAGIGAAPELAQTATQVPTFLQATKSALGTVGKQVLSAPGFIGGAMTAVPEWEAAKQSGASDEEAFGTLLKNYLVGQTEAIPIQNLLTRLNRVTGNQLINTVKTMGMGALEEGTQEAIQTYLTNQIAKTDYDPDRDPLFQVLESAKVGGIVGFLIPGMVSVAKNLPVEKRVKVERKIKEVAAQNIVDDVGNTGNPELNEQIDKEAEVSPQVKDLIEEPKVEQLIKEENAESIRENERQVQEPGTLGQERQSESSENLQQPTPKESSNTQNEIINEKTENATQGDEGNQITREEGVQVIPSKGKEVQSGAPLSFDQTPEYQQADQDVREIAYQIRQNPDDETLFSRLNEAKQARDNARIQFEQRSKTSKQEKSVQLTPSEATEAQIRILDRGIKLGRNITREEVISKINDVAKEVNLSPRQIQVITSKAKQVSLTPESITKFNDFVSKVATDAQTAEQYAEATQLRSKIRLRAKRGTFKEKALLKQFTRVNPNDVVDIDEYNQLANSLVNGKPFNIDASEAALANIVGKIHSQELQVSAKGTSEEILDKIEDKRKADREAIRIQNLADELGIDFDQAKVIDENEEQTDDKARKEIVRQNTLKIANEKSIEPGEFDVAQQKDVNDISAIDPSLLTTKQLKDYIATIDRINENGDFSGAGKVAAIGKAQQGWKELSKLDTHILNLNYLEQILDSQPMAIEAIFGLPKDAALFQLYSGIKPMNDAAAISIREAENFADVLKALQNKYNGMGFDDGSLHRQGIYQELIRRPESMGEDEAFTINKELVESTINKKRENGFEKEAAVDEQYFKPFRNAKSFQEVKDIMTSIDPAGKRVVDAMIDFHKSHRLADNGMTFLELIKSDNERFEDKDIEEVDNYGAPRVWKKIGRSLNVDFDDISEYNPVARAPKPKQLKSGMSLSMRDREGSVLDFNIHKNSIDNIQRSLLRAYAKPFQYQIREFIKDEAALQKLFGGKDAESMKKANKLIDQIFDENTGIFFNFERDLLKNGRPYTSKFVKGVSTFLNGLKKTGYALTLSGFTQAPKQATVLANVAVQLGKKAGMVATSQSELSANKDLAKDFFRGESVDTRGEQASLLNVGRFYNASSRLEAEGKLNNFLSNYVPQLADKRFRNKWSGAGILTATDVSVAKTSFLAFYRQYLDQHGVEYQGLKKENELRNDKVRQEARAFAKQRVDTLQVVSNQAEQGSYFKEQGLLPELARAFLTPYGSFAATSKARLYNDWATLKLGNSQQKRAAVRDITATFVEQGTFNIVSQSLKLGMYTGIGFLLRSLYGLSDETDWQKWYENTKKQIAKDLTFSNLPILLGSPGEDGLVDLINYAYFSFLKQNEPEMTQKEYEKNHAPLSRYKNYDQGWWDYLGPFGAAIAKISDAVETTKDATSGELTKSQQKLVLTVALAQYLQVAGLLPADVTNAARGELNKQKAASRNRKQNPVFKNYFK